MAKYYTLIFFLLIGFYETYSQSVDDLGTDLNDEILKLFRNYTETSKTKECVCVAYYLCDDQQEVIVDGKYLLDVRFGEKKCDNTNTEVFNVCCFLPKTSVNNDDDNKLDTASEFVRNPTVHYECGTSNRAINQDTSVKAGDFPWMVQLLKMDYFFNYGFVCGGTLIHPQIVLTAAHCISSKNPAMYKVRAGQINRSVPSIYADIDVDVITIHPGYYSGLLYNDIALLVLRNPFPISNDIKPVCLSSLDEDISKMNCAVTGWGTSDTGSNAVRNMLQVVKISTVPKLSCEKTLRTARFGNSFRLHSNSFCAGGGAEHNVCVGDSGGPLVCNNGKHYVQGGIVSWGVGCGSTAVHGVYTNVAHFNMWINDQIRLADL